MLEVNRLEFEQPLDLIGELLDTGNAYLTCIDKDEFWGENSYTCNGENQLGIILMRIRDEIGKGVFPNHDSERNCGTHDLFGNAELSSPDQFEEND